MRSGLIILVVGIACLFFMTVIQKFIVVSAPLPEAKIIVLLAGSYEERIPVVADIYHKGKAEKVIVTDDNVRRGWSSKHQRNLYSWERSFDSLVALGVPRQAIVVLPFRESGTVFDALAVRDYVAKEHVCNIMLVTSEYHARRTLWIFRRVLKDMPVLVGITPAPSRLFSISSAKEPFKLLYYWLRYGVSNDPTVFLLKRFSFDNYIMKCQFQG